MTLTVVIVFFALALLGMPLAFALGFASLGGFLVGGIELTVMPQRMMHAVNSFPLMAIPLFMLAGELMVRAGIMQRLIEFSNSIVGRLHGGLAHVAIVAGMMLAAVSGAAVASASALGSTLVPAMRKTYDDGYSSSVVPAAANLGAIIPPSNAMIVYALMAGSTVSVGGLFMAGVVPGILLTLGFAALASFISWRKGYKLTGEAFRVRRALRETWRALPVLLMPVVVVGGIVGGVEGGGVIGHPVALGAVVAHIDPVHHVAEKDRSDVFHHQVVDPQGAAVGPGEVEPDVGIEHIGRPGHVHAGPAGGADDGRNLHHLAVGGKVHRGAGLVKAGHMGAARVTTQNLQVVRTDAERGLIMVKGAVPGAKGGWVTIKDAVKKPTPENLIYPAALKSAAEEAKRVAEEAAAQAAAEEEAAAKAAAEAEQAALEAAEAEAEAEAQSEGDAETPEGGEDK